MNDTDRLHFLAGEVSALRAFAMAVIQTHPNLPALQAEFERLRESQTALSNPVPVREEYFGPTTSDGRRSVQADGRVESEVATPTLVSNEEETDGGRAHGR
jgi:hypothetical protein